MHHKLKLGLVLGVAFGFAVANAASASTNLIKNGSFEDVGNTFFNGPGGVAGWSESGTIDDGAYPVAIQYNQISEYPTGAQGELVPTDNAPTISPDGAGAYGVYFVSDQAHDVSIYQNIYLTPGSYDIGFDAYFTENGFVQPADADLTATIAGVDLANIDIATITPQVWKTYSGEAKISAAGDYLVAFTFNTPMSPEHAKDVVIDQAYVLASADGGGVPISGAPEPSTWAMMLAGVGLTGAMLRVGRARRWAALRATA